MFITDRMRKNKYLQEIFSKKLIQGKSFESGIIQYLLKKNVLKLNSILLLLIVKRLRFELKYLLKV
jgi:hypothetical protein